MWLHHYQTTRTTSAMDVGVAVAVVILAVMLHGVWRLWKGMRRDAFELGLQALRHRRPGATLSFPQRRDAPSDRAGWRQVSLLPLMLVSSGLAILLAQAQRPDEMGRSVTWLLFVGVASWYGTWSWSRGRGVGPLRNFAWGGVCGGVAVSALLWGFYLAVDSYWNQISYSRLTASTGTLMWWTAAGGVVGGLIGSFRANLSYWRVTLEVDDAAAIVPRSVEEVEVRAEPRGRRRAWGAIAAACAASVLFHCSAAPHLNRLVDHQLWVWDWHYDHSPRNAMTLTMAAADRTEIIQWPQVLVFDGPAPPQQALTTTDPPKPATSQPAVIISRNTVNSDIVGGNTRVAVARSDIAPGTIIDPEMFSVIKMVNSSGRMGYADPSRLRGMIATQPLAAGETIVAGTVASFVEVTSGIGVPAVVTSIVQANPQTEREPQVAIDAFQAGLPEQSTPDTAQFDSLFANDPDIAQKGPLPGLNPSEPFYQADDVQFDPNDVLTRSPGDPGAPSDGGPQRIETMPGASADARSPQPVPGAGPPVRVRSRAAEVTMDWPETLIDERDAVYFEPRTVRAVMKDGRVLIGQLETFDPVQLTLRINGQSQRLPRATVETVSEVVRGQ